MNRRELGTLMGGAVAHLLLGQLLARNAFAGSPVKPLVDRWIADLHEMALDLRNATITPREWQRRIALLFDRVPLDDLLSAIDFTRLAADFPTPDKGTRTKPVALPSLERAPDGPTFIGKLFGLKKDRAIIPHGHRNMASCHLVLEGELHLRQFDRVGDDEGSLILEPTIDEVVGRATHSSISDEHNNVHWLIARSDVAYTFDVIVLGLGGKRYEIENLDPDRGEKLEGGLVRVPKLAVAEALEKYGHVPHHEISATEG